ncbi:GNAT family N-acetyltransferase [Bacillus shivajii]|uniref:GNAT family N-acetyltransferase n=1 Tax=Bacillus shivajii TaxID=1983719 RepID=UPI001CFBE6C9|nr:GNAT family N-acetyltransferase [Bacillus shivajii]UCZ53878.1 GNAT family N-acetyltransferase [Bacillus shivajii]
MEVRLMEAIDAEAYRALRLEALRTNPESFASGYEEEKENSVAFYKKRLQSDSSFTYGAFYHERLVGVVTLVRDTKQKMNHRANIVAMYVTPEVRGKGIGRKVMKAAIEKAKELNGLRQIYLTVVTDNTPAKKLYESIGFVTYGVDKEALHVGGTYLDEDWMVLFL